MLIANSRIFVGKMERESKRKVSYDLASEIAASSQNSLTDWSDGGVTTTALNILMFAISMLEILLRFFPNILIFAMSTLEIYGFSAYNMVKA